MTVPVWPAELERPLRDGYNPQRGEGRRLSSEDAGPFRVARRYSSIADSVRMTFDWSRVQLARFNRFYVDEVAHGSLPFWMPDWEFDGLRLLTDDGLPLLTDDGTPLLMASSWLVLFGRGLPSRSLYGVRCKVSFEIAVMP